MPYTDYDLESAIEKFEITRITPLDEQYTSFISEFNDVNELSISSFFSEFIRSSIKAYYKFEGASEIWLRTNFIFPFLHEMREKYENLMLWEGKRLDVDPSDGLTGEPDYFVTKSSRFPRIPYFIVGEAKKDNFEKGWGQCLAAMIAAQRLNQKEAVNIPIYGVVTSGKLWEFGKLNEKNFITFPTTVLTVFEEQDRTNILNILHTMFKLCDKYVSR